jgi:hypothetical protein
MNDHFVRVHYFMGRKVDIGCGINVLRIIRLRFFRWRLCGISDPGALTARV